MTRRPKEKLAYLKFFPTDWRSDPRLRMCSAAARGLWIEMMCLMHEAEPYGHLLVSGQRPTDAQLAVLAGIPPDQLPDLLGELEAAGVFSRTGQGAIYSRRMTRDEKKRRIARKNGKSGGNPSLGNNKGILPSDNQNAKGQDKTQRPEARVQKEEKEKATPSPKKGARLPPDWLLPREWGEWAVSEGMDELSVRREAEKFRDYWHSLPGQRGVKLDWEAVWRNWIRKAMDRYPTDPKPFDVRKALGG